MATKTDGTLSILDTEGNSQSVAATIREFTPSVTTLSDTYYQYEASLEGLKPGASYSYRITCNGAPAECGVTGPLKFETASDGAFRFLHLADSGSGNDAQLALARQMTGENPAFVLANGDLAYELATFASFDSNYFQVYRDQLANTPFFASLGNHEYYTNLAAPALAGRVTPTAGVPPADWGRYYSFDWSNAHIVVLDSNNPLTDAIAGKGAMLNWLDQDLRATRKYWRIAMFHHTPYSTGKHKDEPEAGRVRDYIVPILERYGVQLVLAGHEHTYQRSYTLLNNQTAEPNAGGIVYITSGGGGAETAYYDPDSRVALSSDQNHYLRADVSGGVLSVHAVPAQPAAELDSIQLAPKPRITDAAVNSVSYSPQLASGSLATIFGRNLAPFPFASSLNDRSDASPVRVLLNDVRLPILYADAGQINTQIPFTVDGPLNLDVATANGSARTTADVRSVSPAIFTVPDGSRYAVARHRDGSMVSPDQPAVALENIVILVVGLGRVNGDIEAGKLPASPLPVKATVQVLFGSIVLQATATLSANMLGIYEVAIRVPQVVPRTAAEVRVIADGIFSNTALIALA